MRKVITAITTRTDAEWPPDHPLRKGAKVLTNQELRELPNVVLVCSLAGEDRIPSKDDPDVESTCNRCHRTIFHRASAPEQLEKLCHLCFAKL